MRVFFLRILLLGTMLLMGCSGTWPGFSQQRTLPLLIEGKISLTGTPRLDYQTYLSDQDLLSEIFSPQGQPLLSIHQSGGLLIMVDHENREAWEHQGLDMHSSLLALAAAENRRQLTRSLEQIEGIRNPRVKFKKGALRITFRSPELGKVKMDVKAMEPWQWEPPPPFSLPGGYTMLTAAQTAGTE